MAENRNDDVLKDFMQTIFPHKSPEHMGFEARIILQNAAATAKFVLEEKKKMNELYPDENRPLFVLSGEHHYRSSHQLHHASLLHILHMADIYSVACGFELPHNEEGFLSDSIPVSRKFLANYILRNDIPSAFLDSSRRYEADKMMLDMTSNFNRQAAIGLNYNPDDSYTIGQRRGMHIRNRHMASIGRYFAEATKADIVLIPTGLHHIIGTKENYKQQPIFHESLCADLKELGQHVIVIPYDLSSRFNTQFWEGVKQKDIPSHGITLPWNRCVSTYDGGNKALKWVYDKLAERKNKREIAFNQNTKAEEYKFILPITRDLGLDDYLPKSIERNIKGADLSISPSVDVESMDLVRITP